MCNHMSSCDFYPDRSSSFQEMCESKREQPSYRGACCRQRMPRLGTRVPWWASFILCSWFFWLPTCPPKEAASVRCPGLKLLSESPGEEANSWGSAIDSNSDSKIASGSGCCFTAESLPVDHIVQSKVFTELKHPEACDPIPRDARKRNKEEWLNVGKTKAACRSQRLATDKELACVPWQKSRQQSHFFASSLLARFTHHINTG